MKKIFLVLLLILTVFMSSTFCEDVVFAENDKVIINSSYTYLYKTSELSEHYDFKILANEILDYQEETTTYYKVSYTFEETNYVGYIPYEIASVYTPPKEEILVYNGKVIKDTFAYDITTNEKLEDLVLSKGQQIYIYEGFNSKEEYTKIKFTYGNQVYTAKILTKDVSPNGINKGVVISLSIISALVAVVLILLGLKKTKKWHKILKFFKK